MPRPSPRFHDFIGLKPTVDYLRHLIDGATTRGEPLPHTMLLGPSGVGKTRLSRAIAAEYGTSLVEAMGFEDRACLTQKLVGLSTNDFLFIDECHRLRGLEQELLCQAIDGGTVPAPNQRRADPAVPQGEWIALKPWSLILATDQPGLLLDALRKRIDVEIPLAYYEVKELKEIVASMAGELNMLVSPQAARLIATISAGLPRRAKQILKNLRLYFPGSEARQISLEQVRGFLEASGFNEAGLNIMERRYLDFVADLGGASLESIASGLGTDSDDVRRQVEPNLVRRHLVKITSAGRKLTPKGVELLRDRSTGSVAVQEEIRHDEG
jgi:Holliday junction DNA helicase RuvB